MITLGLVLVIIGIFLAVHYGLAYLLASPELKAIQGPLMPKIVPTPPPQPPYLGNVNRYETFYNSLTYECYGPTMPAGVTDILVMVGSQIVWTGLGEVMVNNAAQNYVNAIIGIVGLIVAAVGIGLMIAGVIMGIIFGLRFADVRMVLQDLKKEGKDIDNWMKNGTPTLPETIKTVTNGTDHFNLGYSTNQSNNQTNQILPNLG